MGNIEDNFMEDAINEMENEMAEEIEERLMKKPKPIITGRWVNFNQRANLYLYGPKPVKVDERIIKDEDKTLRLTTYKVGKLTLYTFGLFSHNPAQRPGHGGEWSSNSDYINKRFNTSITEIAYNQTAMAISVYDMKGFMPKGKVWFNDNPERSYYQFQMGGARMTAVDLQGNDLHFDQKKGDWVP